MQGDARVWDARVCDARPPRFAFAAVCRASAVLAICIGVAGCGASRAHRNHGVYVVAPDGARRELSAPAIKFKPRGLQTLVREPLQGGSYVTIVGKRYEFAGRTYSVLAEHVEERGKRGMVSGGGGDGPSMEPGAPGVVALDVGQECVGSDEVVIAYGLLREPEDTVTAEGAGRPITFSKVMIPASFHARGVLVYALLKSGRMDILTRERDGRVVREEPYALQPLPSCR